MQYKVLRRIIVYLLKLTPFLILYWLYEYVRAVVVAKEIPVHYAPYVGMEIQLFGKPLGLWFAAHRNILLDIIAGLVYALHPVYFIVFAIIMLIKDVKLYRELVVSFTIASIVALTVYALYPTEPPWMVYPGIVRPPNLILRFIELMTGVRIDPNPYAAMPSMHVCMATIFAWFTWKSSSRRTYRIAAVSWPLLMSFATLYTVNHYVADIAAGALLGVFSCWLAKRLMEKVNCLNILKVLKLLFPRSQ
jgi:membrane-associated phospholipid phosphatase